MSELRRVTLGNAPGALEALRVNGCVIVVSALDRGWLEQYAAEALRFHRYLADLDPDGIDPDHAVLRHVKKYHSIQSGFTLSPALMLEQSMHWLPCSIIFLIRNSPLAALGQRYLGSSNCGFMLDAASIRLQPPEAPERALAWHQDAHPASIRSERDRGITYWVPLTDVDASTPTLELFPVQLDEMYPTRSDAASYVVLADEAGVLERIEATPEPVARMRLGDVLIMDCFTLHRTFIPSGAKSQRLSADIRMRPLQALSRDYSGHILV